MDIRVHSGIGSNDYQLRVGNGEKTVEFTYFWPLAMTDTRVLHRGWEGGLVGNIEDFHSNSISFDVFLKSMLKIITEKIKYTVPFGYRSKCMILFRTGIFWVGEAWRPE